MEIPIQVAVRICPVGLSNEKTNNKPGEQAVDNQGNSVESKDLDKVEENDSNGNCCIQATTLSGKTSCTYIPSDGRYAGTGGGIGDVGGGGVNITSGVIQVGAHAFPATHALQLHCSQNDVFQQTVLPFIASFMEGFDISIVTYGQKSTGKTFTLYGNGIDCHNSVEAEEGMVQRCVREIFSQIANHVERKYAVNIGWLEVSDKLVRDVLGMGNVRCVGLSDVLHWLQIGYKNLAATRSQMSHSLFTLTMEQQWISKEGFIQHRLSTISFSDLCASERSSLLKSNQQTTSVVKDLGLQALHQVVNILTEPTLIYKINGNIPYGQTTLTTLLKDSFGGRAQTLMFLCVSPFEKDISETLNNLQFAYKVQCVRNYVVMNTFSDNNTPAAVNGKLVNLLPQNSDRFGLQFTASQWLKLIANAEGLFSRIMGSYAISDTDKVQIEEWLYLKQECEECLSSNELMRPQKQLKPIQEADEPHDTSSAEDEEELSVQENADSDNNDSDNDLDSEMSGIDEKIDSLMLQFTEKTDALILSKHLDYMRKHPKIVNNNSQDNFIKPSGSRRNSLQPGTTLSSVEMTILNQAAAAAAASASTKLKKYSKHPMDKLLDNSSEKYLKAKTNPSPLQMLQKKLRKLDMEIEAHCKQIKELEATIHLKQNIIGELQRNSETRTTAKQKFNKKRTRLLAEYEKSKKSLAKALQHGKDKSEIERLKAVVNHLERRLQDITSIKHIAGESGENLKKLQNSLHESKQVLDELQSKLKREKKIKQDIENEIKLIKGKENTLMNSDDEMDLKQVNQITLETTNSILKEKCANFENQMVDADKDGNLRHEIRNLRRTRDHLLAEKCSLDVKLKHDRNLSDFDERKLLECDEAIEAIDAAIEFKNELICGHKSIDTSEYLEREKGEQLLMARLNRLSLEEMRILLYKYFNKVIDLKDSSQKLEYQLMQLERERDAWEWKERLLTNAIRQTKLEGERNIALLQKQHEMQKALILRHLVEETNSTSSTSYTDSLPLTPTMSTHSNHLDRIIPYSEGHTTNKIIKTHKLTDMEMHPLTDPTISKYKPLDKFKEKSREAKSKLFKFQVLTKYSTTTNTTNTTTTTTTSTSTSSNKSCQEMATNSVPSTSSTTTAIATTTTTTGKCHQDHLAMMALTIPEENRKKLTLHSNKTKVTRQKNKIIIQDSSRRN